MSTYVRDLVERVAMSFIEGFLGAVVVTEMTNQTMWYAAAAAGVASAAALLKGLVARGVGNKGSASLSGGV